MYAMKKSLIIIAAALLSLAACSKVTMGEGNADEHAISFQVANYVQTKADDQASPVKFSNEDFGTYAWYNADDESQMHVPFMVNEQVTFDEANNWWTTDRPYYWPKLGTLDFISYSPYRPAQTVTVTPEGTAGGQGDGQEQGEPQTETRYYPEITENSIAWTDFYVDSYQVDLMYSDKAVGQRETSKKDTYTSVSGVNGVPTLFHHALARLHFGIRATFLDDATENRKATTTWEVYVQAVRLLYVNQLGSLSLTLNENDGKSWVLPTTEEGYHVWNLGGYYPNIHLLATNSQGGSDDQTIPGLALTTDAQELNAEPLYVIPQILKASDDSTQDVFYGQKLEVQLTIVTHLPGKDDNGNPLFIREDITRSWDLAAISSLPAWEMNQDITYVINIKPTANITTPEDPQDVKITFDPAVNDWTPVTAQAVIQF